MPQLPQPPSPRGRHVRPAIVDQLEIPRDDLDVLIRDMRLGFPSQHAHDAYEERAQMIAAALLAPFRGARPAEAPPLRLCIDPKGKCGAWF